MKIRKALISDIKQIARVHVDSWRTAYKGIMSDEYLDNLSCDNRERNWKKRLFENKESTEFMYVAENEEEKIVGFASADIDKEDKQYQGTLYTLYILEPYQRIGIGKELVKSVVKKLKENGINSLKLWAFEDNPSRKFYEKFGGKIMGKKVSKVGYVQLNELLYGWKDINDIRFEYI